MYKKNILSIILLLISIILVISFDAIEIFDTLLYLVPLLFSINIMMIIKRKNIKKFKSIYNVIMLLITFFSILLLGYMTYSFISCSIDIHCMNNYEVEGLLLLLTTLYTLLFINIFDIKIKHNKMYYILLYIISLVIFIIYGRYFLDIDLYHNYMNINKSNINIQISYIFITQNYIYFNLLYISLLIYYFINRKNHN